MSARDLAAVVVTTLGLWWVLQGFWSVVYAFPTADPNSQFPIGLSELLLAASAQLLFGAGIVLARNRVAAWLFPDSAVPGPQAMEFQSALFSLFGLALLVHAAYSQFSAEIEHLLQQSRFRDELGSGAFVLEHRNDMTALRISRAAEAVLGTALLFGGAGLSQLVNRVRRAGVQK